eukprot:g3953.t1
MSDLLRVFSLNVAGIGITTGIFGKFIGNIGPKRSVQLGAFLWTSGLATGAYGAHVHSLALLYLGYGIVGGCGIGFGYLGPLLYLQSWFPDRRGLAAGLAVAGFGGGTIVVAPLIKSLLETFREAPTFLGDRGVVECYVEAGQRFVDVEGVATPVTIATNADIVASGWADAVPALSEGVYVLGTGSTGSIPTMLSLAGVYGACAAGFSSLYRSPPKNLERVLERRRSSSSSSNASQRADGKNETDAAAAVAKRRNSAAIVPGEYVTSAAALRSPQFWFIGGAVFFYSTGGWMLMASGKTMIAEVYGSIAPEIVTAGVATAFVSGLSAANLGGRVGWGVISDVIGSRKTIGLFGVLGAPACLSVPLWADLASNGSVVAGVAGFVGSSLLVVTVFGGLFSVLMSYNTEVFGAKEIPAIHGKLLVGSSLAAFGGPFALGYLRNTSAERAIFDLASAIEPAAFESSVGASVSELPSLIESKLVTIPQLLDLAPVGTTDPTPFLYNTSLQAAGGAYLVGLAFHAATRPVAASSRSRVGGGAM